jgi:hypothetical protein
MGSNRLPRVKDSGDSVDGTADSGERDIWWGGYSSRAFIPWFAGCAALSIAAIVAAAWLYESYDMPPLPVRYTTYAFTGTLWGSLVARWCYLVLTRTYRLTTRRLYLERTFLRRKFRELELERIANVRVAQTRLGRRFDVGRLLVYEEGKTRPVVLEGIHRPADVAIAFRGLLAEKRESPAN